MSANISSLKTKVAICKALVVLCTALWSQTWQMSATEKRTLQTFHQRCLRKITGVNYLYNVKNKETLKRTVQRDRSEKIREDQIGLVIWRE